MSFHATQDALYEAFGAFGEVQNVRIPTDKETGRVKGFAYVEYGSVDEAQKALESLQEADIGGRNVRLDFAQERQPNGDSPGGFGGGEWSRLMICLQESV
jgi:nucleolin